MPIYPYRCNSCGKRWEAFHKVAERSNETCCGTQAIREIGVQMKPQVMDEYMATFGTVVTGPAHMRRLMKERDLEEVGQKEIERSVRKWM